MSHRSRRRLAAALANAAAAAASILGAPAHAAGPSGAAVVPHTISKEIRKVCSGDCDTLRAVFYDDPAGVLNGYSYDSSDRIEYWGGSACSATTSDTDFKMSVLPPGWNDRISAVADFNGCDVKLYWDRGFQGRTTPSPGYTNYGEGGRNLSANGCVTCWDNKTSSFKVS